MKVERYISVDIESAGPIVGKHSMLSVGACLVDRPTESFYTELKPIGPDFDTDALKVSGFDLQKLAKTGEDPVAGMKRFFAWIKEVSGSERLVFLGFNACYDWQFVNRNLLSYCGSNPFGFGGVAIKSFYMGKSRAGWLKSSSSQLPREFRRDCPLSHGLKKQIAIEHHRRSFLLALFRLFFCIFLHDEGRYYLDEAFDTFVPFDAATSSRAFSKTRASSSSEYPFSSA